MKKNMKYLCVTIIMFCVQTAHQNIYANDSYSVGLLATYPYLIEVNGSVKVYKKFWISGFWAPKISFQYKEEIASETQAEGVNILSWKIINQAGHQPVRVTIGPNYGFNLIYKFLKNYSFFSGIAWERLEITGTGNLKLDILLDLPLVGETKIKDIGSTNIQINSHLYQTSLRFGGNWLYSITDHLGVLFSAAVAIPLTRKEEWKLTNTLAGPLKAIQELANEDLSPTTQKQISEKEQKGTNDLKEGGGFIRSIHPVASIGILYIL